MPKLFYYFHSTLQTPPLIYAYSEVFDKIPVRFREIVLFLDNQRRAILGTWQKCFHTTLYIYIFMLPHPEMYSALIKELLNSTVFGSCTVHSAPL